MTSINIEKAKILIVDDSSINLKFLSNTIASEGWEIIVATDGDTAIKQAEYAQPDLILLDVMMPGIDGFETCDRLKANAATSHIPVIFMTALSNPIDKVKGLSIGAVDYITKPFQKEELIARLKLHLKLNYLTKEYATQNQLLKQEIAERIAAETALQQLAEELEKKVEQRTAELKKALQELQQTQIQLVQNEKMSTLGQLVAGVAHEINNPVNSISGNLKYLENYLYQILKILKLYIDKYPELDKEIQSEIQSFDLEFLMEDLPYLLKSLKAGTESILNISKSLRLFSRADNTTKIAFNIHEGIESTLLILKHRLKANKNRPEIKVIAKYGNLPLIDCYPGQLNQVFMNILANAIDALEDQGKWCLADEKENQYPIQNTKCPTIWIRTEISADNKNVIISIKDNGPGMSPEVMKRAFEQLFTTKKVGAGTGLGLSISRQIVEEKHQGKLSCISAPGEGAEFIIELPISSTPKNEDKLKKPDESGLNNMSLQLQMRG
ncbi:MAG: response regulator [Oscillatoriaceae bacterium SKW80]|nr:response regulator [Oscillatoriaceae bacterium SKYG93]MCX8120734.1 response regulator [Oscillatoriaceae bacterium SKW80]MDW8453728.1 response regulator [Oscillatoriaceae cyanobacterium SKYGB_i_bin93]HIK26960.1 response regulator [Oscillatoriaceae cyanobacterium M7585_C2015_266]